MSKTIAYAGVLAAALLLSSAGAAAAETDGGYLGPAGELLPGSVTGSLPGYTSGPLGSTATLACNIGTVVGTAAQLMGAGLPIPVGIICAVVNPVAESADFLLDGDIDGSVGAVVGECRSWATRSRARSTPRPPPTPSRVCWVSVWARSRRSPSRRSPRRRRTDGGAGMPPTGSPPAETQRCPRPNACGSTGRSAIGSPATTSR